jgi:hypothetical protein
MGPTSCPETSARNTTIRCVTTQKSAFLIYFAVEACNHKLYYTCFSIGMSAFLSRTALCTCKATAYVPVINMHALPCAYRRLAFLCPTLQRPARSTIASPRARSLLLLENSASKFDVRGVEHISKQVSVRGISLPT